MLCDKCFMKDYCEEIKFKWLEEINCMYALEYVKKVLDRFCPLKYAMAKALDEYMTDTLASLVLEEFNRTDTSKED